MRSTSVLVNPSPKALLVGTLRPARKPLRALAVGSCSALFALSCFVSTAQAQNRAELSKLIFDVVPLTAEAQQETAQAAQGDGSGSAANSTGDSNSSAEASDTEELALDEQEIHASLQEQIQRYRDSIAELSRNSQSPYSEALREQNHALGLLLVQAGDYEGAIPVLEAAMHIDRVNYGLYTPRQVELVDELIRVHDSLGNYDQVADYEEYLFYIQTRSYAEDDPRRIAATERWADWNVESFLKTGPQSRFGSALSYSTSTDGGPGYVAVQASNGMVYFFPRDRLPYAMNPGMPGGGFSEFNLRTSPYALTPEMMVDERLKTAQKFYEQLQENDSVSPEHKAELQRKQANIAFTLKRQMDSMLSSANRASFGFNTMRTNPVNPVTSRGYQENVESLEKLAKDLEADANATPESRARAYLDLGDWHLSFERYNRAEAAYRKAWEALGSPSTTAGELHPVLHPDYLMPVPTFVQHPYSRELNGVGPTEELEYKGHVDVTLGIDRRGRVTREKIIASSEGTSQVLRNALMDYLRESRMRPFLVDGEPRQTDSFTLRFYYTY